MFVVDPGSLVLDLANSHVILRRDAQNVLNASLSFQLIKGLIAILVDLPYHKLLLSKYFLLALSIVYYLDNDIIRSLVYLKLKNLLPDWFHVVRRSDCFGVLALFVPVIHYYLNLRVELLSVKECLFEPAINDV